MSDRIETIYENLDDMAKAITEKQDDPYNAGEPCKWPETFLAWKEKVLQAQDHFGARPLSQVQWWAIESYMINQYNFGSIADGGEG